MRNQLCKLKFEIENCKFLGKFVLISFLDSILNYIPISGSKHTRFLLISVKSVAVFAQNKSFEKSKITAKMADMS